MSKRANPETAEHSAKRVEIDYDEIVERVKGIGAQVAMEMFLETVAVEDIVQAFRERDEDPVAELMRARTESGFRAALALHKRIGGPVSWENLKTITYRDNAVALELFLGFVDHEHYPSIIEACVEANHYRCLSLLISAGADVHSLLPCGSHAITVAASSKSFECAEILLDDNVSPNPSPNHTSAHKDTPLCCAVSNGDVRMVELLLSRGADVDQEVSFSRTVMFHLTCFHPTTMDIAKLLLDAHGKYTARGRLLHKDYTDSTPLMHYLGYSHVDLALVKYLLDRTGGARFDSEFLVAARGGHIHTLDTFGASRKAHYAAGVKAILDRKYDVLVHLCTAIMSRSPSYSYTHPLNQFVRACKNDEHLTSFRILTERFKVPSPRLSHFCRSPEITRYVAREAKSAASIKGAAEFALREGYGDTLRVLMREFGARVGLQSVYAAIRVYRNRALKVAAECGAPFGHITRKDGTVITTVAHDAARVAAQDRDVDLLRTVLSANPSGFKEMDCEAKHAFELVEDFDSDISQWIRYVPGLSRAHHAADRRDRGAILRMMDSGELREGTEYSTVSRIALCLDKSNGIDDPAFISKLRVSEAQRRMCALLMREARALVANFKWTKKQEDRRITELVLCAALPWTPETHWTFGKDMQARIMTFLLANNRCQIPMLPELTHRILGYL